MGYAGMHIGRSVVSAQLSVEHYCLKLWTDANFYSYQSAIALPALALLAPLMSRCKPNPMI